jgi:hypothetical protein
MHHRRHILLSVSFLLAASCGPGEEQAPALGQRRDMNVATNGVNINGVNINGVNINGTGLAATLAAVQLAGVTLPGGELSSAWLDGSMIRGTLNGLSVSGLGMDEAEFNGIRGDGTGVRVKIDSVTAPPSGNDVWRYNVAYQKEDGNWAPICPGSGVLSVAVSGRWNYQFGTPGGGSKQADSSVFTFGCAGAAVEKCVTMGYRPWASHQGVNLDAHHQACVRLIRADYCGEGVTFTTNGRTINLYDALGIQTDDRLWVIDAEWDTTGARCVSALSRSLLGILCPDNILAPCGAPSHFNSGTLLMSETLLGGIGGILR